MRAVPYAGVHALAAIAARTMLARAVLSVLLVALVVAAAAAARHPKLNEKPFLPPQAQGMVVLDLSASISQDTYERIGQTLDSLAAKGGRYGLVVFSADAYEALPPGTPASALKPMVRYFTLGQAPLGEQPQYPINPWSNDFTGGTEISKGLDLARQVLVDNHVKHPAIVLISDLADDQNDVPRLTTVLLVFRAEGVRLRVIALNAAPSDFRYFKQYASKILPAKLPGTSPTPTPQTSFPSWLVFLAILVALALGANELRSARLRWGDASGVAG